MTSFHRLWFAVLAFCIGFTGLFGLYHIKSFAQGQIVFDFVAEAHQAEWFNERAQNLPFPGDPADRRGFVRRLDTATLEDQRQYRNVLQTHPRWASEGTIWGKYRGIMIPPNAALVAKVGFLQGATGTDGVTFVVDFKPGSGTSFIRLAEVWVRYDGRLDQIWVDLSRYAGKIGDFQLGVLAGSSSGQDWAVWVDTRIVIGRPTFGAGTVVYDLVQLAPQAQWVTNYGCSETWPNCPTLPFPGSPNDRRGFARILDSAVLEDGREYRNVLETHPAWTTGGQIVGRYTVTIPRNAVFEAQIGFLRGADQGSVGFEVRFRPTAGWSGPQEVVTLVEQGDSYDGILVWIWLDLGRFAGVTGILSLVVNAGDRSAQDWAVWINPCIRTVP